MTDRRPVVVVGLMGAGKTTVSRLLADALGRPWRDSDADLTAQYGDSAADQYARHGQAWLHAREAAQLRQALRVRPAPVVAAAASVVDNPDCRAALARAFVVWLDAPPEVLADRIGEADHRPHYEPDPVMMLRRQYERRAGHFRSLADVTVDVSRHSPTETVAEVLTALTGRPDPGPAADSPADGTTGSR